MTVILNDDGSTRSINGESFKTYVRSIWEEEGTLDIEEFDPDDYGQVRKWVAEWESDE